jgi:hypothetical protein
MDDRRHTWSAVDLIATTRAWTRYHGTRLHWPCVTILPITAVALLGCLLVGCGAGGSRINSTQDSTVGNIPRSDNAQESKVRDIPRDTNTETTPSGLVYDPDDEPVRFYGREAIGVERQTIAKLITRYYADAARDDGAKTCRMMPASAVRELVREDSQRTHSKRCSDIASFEFRQMHEEIKIDAATLEFINIRVKGASGIVLLRFAKAAEPSPLSIQREGRDWKVARLRAMPQMG